MSDLTKAPAQIIVDMINEANTSAGIVTADVQFGAPINISGSNPVRNTELVVSAAPGGRYGGTKTIRYNRLDLSDIVETGSDIFLKGSTTLLSEIVIALNARFGLNMISGQDYTDAPLPTFDGLPGEEKTVTLAAKASSLVYIGSVNLIVRIDTIDLGTIITIEDLNGLTYVPPGG